MTTFSGEFLGCKISHGDLAALRSALGEAGFAEVERGADVHVVNGCCVTAEAMAKTRRAVRRALREGAARVVVTGCAANVEGVDFETIDPRVSIVARPGEETPSAVVDLLAGLGCRGGVPHAVERDRVRAELRIQDGCSFSCAFCVIPLVRGRSRSRPLDAIVAEARQRVAGGQRELVLAGVNIGLYRDRVAGADLPAVVRAVAGVPGVERLRLSSIEVDHVTPALVATLADTAAFCEHLHVPLQSGDDAVLAAMRRRYDADRYRRRIAHARDVLGDLALTADAIVGFPGEDEAAFERTLCLAAEVDLAAVHAFPYSPRPGTRTAGEDPVPPVVKRDRSARLRAQVAAQGLARRGRRVGGTDQILVEVVRPDGTREGYGRDYTRWRVCGSRASAGETVAARAVRAALDGLRGTCVG